ncbi:DUF551 domain-containing protein [Achromobacter animicus]|uniref:DUF551 domain-containing protein n=1 Tax=Achromobacter animicus TaxID=1389935 RepID=UPI0028AC9DD1|nr:DUF551 domain-containing protein [Achromobacter animicus]
MTPIPAGWKPIESAPKDGSLILLGCPDEGPDGRPALCLPGHWLKGWGDAPDEKGQDDGWVAVTFNDFFPGRSFGNPDYMYEGSQPTHWMPLPAAPGSSPAVAPGDAQDEQAAFERWLERTCPSGDVEAVQRQWEASSDYADFYGLVPAPAAGDALDALRELVECDSLKKRIASMQVCVLETEDDVQELDAMMSDLARRQPAAWDAARAALAAQVQQQQQGEA